MSEVEDETTAETVEDDEATETAEDGAGDEEAEAAEAEEAEAEPEPSPEPAGLTEREIDKRFERMERRATTWRNSVSEVLGELAQDLQPCPRCLGPTPGFIMPLSVVQVPDDQKIAVKLSIGELAPPDLLADQNASACPGCAGHGKVKTGSRVPRQDVLTCEDCEGRGWLGTRATRARAATPPDAPPADMNGQGPEAGPPRKDPWGRLLDDPLYGVMPGFERV